ncbi:LacI family DNA-binding transcriptional regulator [Microbacterium ulmi]|uniref:LacI family DNA-binding transcriptional regulator n=1 Tax=Microbacterium ulmi TaxID=179095 RepID=UPI001FBA10E4|nr:LacI family DNA-binding transcriptional regulator [Microbacterium ulmi]NII69052.1 LacI family transcriptional regulator [Microbacterium ulmi]
MARRTGLTTIADVAARAGVSPATVSRIMNGRFAGEPEIAERVDAAARELAYSPSHLGRSLALGQTNAIAFVVPDLGNPTFQTVLSGLSKTAARDGYRVLVADSAESPGDEPLLAADTRRRCDALVLCAPRMPDDRLVALAESLRPLVLINRPHLAVDAPSLAIDYESGIQRVAQHVYDLGHRHLVYVAGPERSVSNRHRVTGLDAFARVHPDVRLDTVAGGASSEEGIAAAASVVGTGATAAIAYNDLVAIGLMNALIDRGVRVPEDLSVTGMDDIPFARFTSPPLTTASVPHFELGVEAWRRMHALIRHEQPAHDLTFQPRIEVRGSTATPRGA